LRIISGQHKGRQLVAPKGLPVRPTTDFARMGLFNILNNRIDWQTITALDLFCGIGGISFELISRGCPEVYCIDRHQPCLKFVAETAKSWGITNLTTLYADVFKWLKKPFRKGFDLIIADPPYAEPAVKDLPEIVLNSSLLNENGILVIEHDENHDFSSNSHFLECRNYGKVHFSLFTSTIPESL
jgi:16S rRNA (guanine966-N2)-methyltransferase